MYKASLSFENMQIDETGGFNYFSSSYDGSKRGGVCEITGVQL
jgi:hypothetical protein